MAEPSLLTTFLQISDLHLDPRGSTSGPGHAPLPRFYHFHQLFDGLLGHHSAALGALEDFYYRLCKTENPRLIVTGDLSRNGSPSQLRMVDDFLGNTVTVSGKTKPIGLGHSSWKNRAVYGNHDHFPGSDWVVGRPAANLGSYLSTPRILYHPTTANKRVFFIMIDTDSDVHPFSFDRCRGVGRFRSELNTLSQSLSVLQYDASQVRVLLMHHSALYNPAPSRGSTYGDLAIHPDSRAALDHFIEQHNVSILLTGHTHAPDLDIYTTSRGKQVLEARSGSTTAMDTHPATHQQYNLTRPLHPNGLIVHRILNDGDRHIWRASVHERTRLGFVPKREKEIDI
jgi:hypothetical protein